MILDPTQAAARLRDAQRGEGDAAWAREQLAAAVYTYALRVLRGMRWRSEQDREDVAQEVTLKLTTLIAEDHSRSPGGESSLVYRSTKNRAIDWERRKKVRPETQLRAEPGETHPLERRPAPGLLPDQQVEANEDARLAAETVAAVLEQLKPDFREVLQAVLLDNKTVAELAAAQVDAELAKPDNAELRRSPRGRAVLQSRLTERIGRRYRRAMIKFRRLVVAHVAAGGEGTWKP